jgi:hypothetical protein
MKMTWFTEVAVPVAGAAVPVPQEVIGNNVTTPITMNAENEMVRDDFGITIRFLHASSVEARMPLSISPGNRRLHARLGCWF